MVYEMLFREIAAVAAAAGQPALGRDEAVARLTVGKQVPTAATTTAPRLPDPSAAPGNT